MVGGNKLHAGPCAVVMHIVDQRKWVWVANHMIE